MEDSEICSLAIPIIEEIVEDLSGSMYAEMGGTLKLTWLDGDKPNAHAKPLSKLSDPPEHLISISYALTVMIYRDLEAYYEFCESGILEEAFSDVFKDYEIKPEIPEGLEKKEIIQNMFFGALTWILFHELGHLLQEHLYIRKNFGEEVQAFISDGCDSYNNNDLSPRAALISHVTEFAADVYATSMCSSELTRHAMIPRDENSRDKVRQALSNIPSGLSREEYEQQIQSIIEEHVKPDFLSYRNNLYLCVSGIASTFYSFNSLKPASPEPIPTGSHPTPVRRLEVCLPNFFEKIDAGGAGKIFTGLRREELVQICHGAAFSVWAFWTLKTQMKKEDAFSCIAKGILEDPHFDTYWKAIVAAWDEVEPVIMEIKRDEGVIGLLSFTDSIRSKFT